ncbi:T9SS type B sorting domain-containing protein [Empedobacter tilapiae]
MKKIFYFLLLMLSGFVWGQYPTIYPLDPLEEGKYLFKDLKLESHVSSFDTSASDCAFSGGQTYKYFSFKTKFDIVFAFDLIASKSDFRFVVWKVQKGKSPNVIFDNGTTIKADRSVQGSTNQKGMKEGISITCESNFSSSATGYAKVFDGTNILKEGETVVIAVYGGYDNVPFDIKVNVAEEREIPHSIFNNLCKGQAYSYQQVIDAIKSHISSNPNPVADHDIKLYRDNTFSTLINDTSTTFNTDTTLYAQVRDTAGNLKFIYTIPIAFKSIIYYNVRDVNEQFCAPNRTFSKEQLIHKVSPSITSDKYSDYEVYLNNIQVGAPIVLQNDTKYNVTLSYIGTEFCPITLFSDSVNFKLENSNPILPSGRFAEICNDEVLSEANILSALDVDVTIYRIDIMPATPYNFEGNEAKFDVQIVDRINSSCKSNIVEFTVKKKANVSLQSLPNFEKCRSDFSLSDFQTKIAEVRNSDTSIDLTINYNGTDYTEAQLQTLYDLILRTTTQSDFNLSITGNKVGFCESIVPLKITLNNSSVPRESFNILLSPSCLGVTEDYTFSVDEIKEHIKGKLGFVNIADFEIVNSDGTPFQPVNVLANSNETLIFKIRKKSESCLSEEMYLIVETVNQPKVYDATYSTKFCEGETLIIDDDLLKNYFGENVFDYKIFIEGVEYIRGNPIQKRLGFGTNISLNISIEFKNTLRETCSKIVNLTINKKQDLVVDIATLETYTKDHSIIYCEGADENAKDQIQTILDYIKTNYSLTSSKTKDQIFDQFNSNNTEVTIDFEDPNFCGIVSIKFFYQKNTLPDFNIPSSSEICSDTKYILDFEELAKEKGLDVNEYTFVVNGFDKTQISIYKYELGVGDYMITISNKDSGCPKEFTLKLLNSEIPIINKITINEKSIIVSAKGNGKLEYALFDSTGKVIVEWQTNNELIIPDNIRDNDFTVKVRLNNCGATERKNVIYLSLPNVVTPNQDGKNDFWQPMTKNGKVNDTSNSYKLIIFDRFGKQILSQEGIDIIKWDGTLNGKPVADGTYWYMLEFSKQSDDMQVLYSGSILVKRKIK